MKTNLKPCPDCGNGVSHSARRCPQCGHKFTTATGFFAAMIIGLIIGIIGIILLGTALSNL
jgi:uncharacterized protein (DUF983 family)